MVLGDAARRRAGVRRSRRTPRSTIRRGAPIGYEETGPVGFLHFAFYNGAMSTGQCERLREAYAYARSRPTRVIVLMGGPDFWSNGIHLNLIEASPHPAEESWRNINAMNDLVRDIILTDRQLTIAALSGNAGAGGVFLALAADRVCARDGVILNPHYKGMGNLYGSEYWTYLLPRRVAPRAGESRSTDNRLPVGARQAAAMGLIDDHFGADAQRSAPRLERRAHAARQRSRVRASCCDAKNRSAAPRTKPRSRSRRTAARSSRACSSTSSASIRATTWRATTSCTSCRARARRSTWPGIGIGVSPDGATRHSPPHPVRTRSSPGGVTEPVTRHPATPIGLKSVAFIQQPDFRLT